MKKIYSFLIVTIILTSCGSDNKKSVEDIIATNNLEQIRKRKTQLDGEQQAIAAQLKQLDAKIKELDPQERVPLITTFDAKESVFQSLC